MNKQKSKENLYNIHPIRHVSDGLFVRHDECYIKIAYDDINWLEASGSYCYIYLFNDKKLVLVHPLSDLEQVLPVDSFIRIHRSCMINIHKVTRIDANMLYIGKKGLYVSRSHRVDTFSCFDFLETKAELRKKNLLANTVPCLDEK